MDVCRRCRKALAQAWEEARRERMHGGDRTFLENVQDAIMQRSPALEEREKKAREYAKRDEQ